MSSSDARAEYRAPTWRTSSLAGIRARRKPRLSWASSRQGQPTVTRHQLGKEKTTCLVNVLSSMGMTVDVVPGVTAMDSEGWRVTAAETSRQGLAQVHGRTFAIVIIHWESFDVSMSDILTTLHRDHADAKVFVCIPASTEAMDAVRAVHPEALLFSGRIDSAELAAWVASVMGRRVGDLRLDGGVVTHEPSGPTHKHPLAVRLVAAHPRKVVAHATGTAMEISRLRAWLRTIGSSVQVRSHVGLGMYSLDVAEVVERAA